MRKKILVVDDDPAILKLLEMYLVEAGYAVLKCGDGVQAVKIAKREAPDLVIMDIMMRDMDGITSANKLKQEEITSNIQLIFLTGLQSKQQELARGNEVAGHMIFAKPFDAKKLVDKINDLLNETNRTGS